MHLRNRVQIHIPVNTGKPEEILIFAPAAAGPFEHLGSKLVFPFLQIWSQFKLRRSKAVLAVTHEISIEPDSNSALRALERDKQRFPLHVLRHLKILHIAGHRIEAGGDLSRLYFLVSLPGVLHVGILGRVVSFHLNVGGNPDIIPGSAAVLLFLKSGNPISVILRIMELPQPVEAIPERIFAQLHAFSGSIISVIRMSRYPVVTEVSRILHQLIIECLHRYPP